MGWLDVAILGLNVYQSSKLNQAEQQLKLLSAGQLQSALKAELLKVLRELVFNINQKVQKLETLVATHPQAVIVATKAMEAQLEEMGVTPQLFDDFNDKEYVVKTFTQLSNTERAAWDAVTPEQRQDAETALRYIKEIPILTEAIDAKIGQETLRTTQATLQEYEADTSKKRNIALGLLAYAIVGCGLLTAIFSNSLLGAFIPITGLIAGIAGLVLLQQSRSADYNELKQMQADALQQANRITPTSPKWQQIISLFGNQDSSTYKRLRNERQIFLEKMLAPIPNLGTQGNIQTNTSFSSTTPIALPSAVQPVKKSVVEGNRILCPHCGHANSQNRLTCKNCRQAIQA